MMLLWTFFHSFMVFLALYLFLFILSFEISEKQTEPALIQLAIKQARPVSCESASR